MAEGDTWYSGLDADHQAHVTSRGWEKLDPAAAAVEAVRAHRSATQMIGVPESQLLRMPKDAQDPLYQTAFERLVSMGVPQSADGYAFDGVKFKDGSDLDPEDVTFVRTMAHELKLTPHQARQVAARMADRASADAEASAAGSAGRAETNQTALRLAWSSEFDQKAFAAKTAAEGLGLSPAVFDYIGTLPADEYVRNMNALVALGVMRNEAVIYKGGREPSDPTASMTGEQASAELERLKSSPDADAAEWRKGYLAGDTKALERFDRLSHRMRMHLQR